MRRARPGAEDPRISRCATCDAFARVGWEFRAARRVLGADGIDPVRARAEIKRWIEDQRDWREHRGRGGRAVAIEATYRRIIAERPELQVPPNAPRSRLSSLDLARLCSCAGELWDHLHVHDQPGQHLEGNGVPDWMVDVVEDVHHADDGRVWRNRRRASQALVARLVGLTSRAVAERLKKRERLAEEAEQARVKGHQVWDFLWGGATRDEREVLRRWRSG